MHDQAVDLKPGVDFPAEAGEPFGGMVFGIEAQVLPDLVRFLFVQAQDDIEMGLAALKKDWL